MRLESRFFFFIESRLFCQAEKVSIEVWISLFVLINYNRTSQLIGLAMKNASLLAKSFCICYHSPPLLLRPDSIKVKNYRD